MRAPAPPTRWSLVAAMRHYEFGWVVKCRNLTEGYVSHWFADRDEAVAVKTALEAGWSFEEALKIRLGVGDTHP